MKSSEESIDVSPNNPCPFLRALVGGGRLPNDVAPLALVADTIVEVAGAGDSSPVLPGAPIRGVAAIANGLSPLQIARNILGGVRLDALRDGPLDKNGSGSRILSKDASVNEAELDRLDSFASDKVSADGQTERGLSADELTTMMDANFERAKGQRRRVHRRMMNAEWPVLLKVMGKDGRSGRYLSVADVRHLVVQRKLPERMSGRLR
ncbi:MAG: hypothetical protein AB8H86_13655 [Polyangiales bacterium]